MWEMMGKKFELNLRQDSLSQSSELKLSCNPQVTLDKPTLDLTSLDQNAELTLKHSSTEILSKPMLELSGATADGELVTTDVTWEGDQTLQILPRSQYQLCRSSSKRPPPPDISRGLGRRQAKKDTVTLAEYMQTRLKLLVRKDEITKSAILYMFDPPCWRPLDEEDAQRVILEQLKKADLGYCINHSDTKAIYKLLRLDPNLYYEGGFDPPKGTINFLDGTYNVLTREFYRHRPNDHFTTYVNVYWEEICGNPCGTVFESFVDNLSGGDPAVRTQLLELIGLLLTRYQIKHFFVLVGESGTGKSQFGRLLTELIGHENVAAVRDVSDFEERWTVGELHGKFLATCLDLPNGPLPPAAIGIIKQFVGDDAIKGAWRYKESATYYRKPLLVMASNYSVRFRNMAEDQAMLNRMVCIPFRNPVPPEKQQQQLYEKLLDEAPYIIREGIGAFQELVQRNYQVTRSELPDEFQPEEGDTMVRDVQRYIKDFINLLPESECTTDDLWNDYCEISARYGLHRGNKITFSRALTRALKSIDAQVEPIKRACGTESRGYRGIAIPERLGDHDHISFP